MNKEIPHYMYDIVLAHPHITISRLPAVGAGSARSYCYFRRSSPSRGRWSSRYSSPRCSAWRVSTACFRRCCSEVGAGIMALVFVKGKLTFWQLFQNGFLSDLSCRTCLVGLGLSDLVCRAIVLYPIVNPVNAPSSYLIFGQQYFNGAVCFHIVMKA